MRKFSLIIAGIFFCIANSFAQKEINFSHVEPPFWWVGMKETSLQIMFHHAESNLSDYQVTLQYPGVTITEVKPVENPHFLFVTVEFAPEAKTGTLEFIFTSGKKKWKYSYELQARTSDKPNPISSADVVYLLMPDRFANGDPSNDTVKGMHEGLDRAAPFGRHGGDLKGVEDHLDYIKDLGITTLWLNPVLENDQEFGSYHGYAITDLYAVDRRLGSNESYKALIQKGHEMGIKMIQDMVMNHIGLGHWMMTDMPTKDWVHQFPEYTQTNYRGNVVSDPYKSVADSIKMSNGWFVKDMPDINQSNSLFAKYLIQNTIWWIEYAGLDGIRMDTYMYPDKYFMQEWMQAINNEYPDFYVVGEVLMYTMPHIGYWQQGGSNKDGYQPHLPSVIDAPLCRTIAQALTEPSGWETGVSRLYEAIGQDFIYPNANHNMTFVDNHDLTRFYRLVKNDLKKFKQGIGFLLTTRGIPQLYYGTELLMDGDGGFHPDIRKDFPGGWKGDSVNAFEAGGRTSEQNEAFDFMKTVLNWRKGETLVHTGKLTHFIPEDDVYVYFRHDNKRAVMVLINGSDKQKEVKTQRYAEITAGFTQGTDIITNQSFNSINTITVPAQGILILDLK